jgi:putative DNA primase/helicase
MAEERKPFHERVAEQLIEQLKTGMAPWQKPWRAGEANTLMPMNPTTGKRYKGANALYLMAQGRSDTRWLTYRQAAASGAQVRKGEKGTPVQYWKFSEQQDKLDEQGRPVRDAHGEKLRETVLLERPRVFFATVFNAEQIDGMPPIARQEQTWNAIDRAEQILQASGARITHAPGDRAFYRPSTDRITLPEKRQFASADRYYATALHELGHWTGHPSRLDRDLAHPFGSEGYAKEELRAEIASMILGDELGIGHDPAQHAAYVGCWIKILQDNPLEIARASADAEKIHHYVLACEQKLEQAAGIDVKSTLPTPGVWAESPEPLAQYPQAQEQEAGMQISSPGSDPLTDQRLSAEAGSLETLETWTLHHLEGDTLGRALELASLEEIDRVREVLNLMQPLNTENAFWGRHELIHAVDELDARIDQAMVLAEELVEQRSSDALMMEEDRMAGNGHEQGRGAGQLPERVYIDVPFPEKDEVKQLGARWDRQQQSWYIPAAVDASLFARWATTSQSGSEGRKGATERVYLAVPYGEHQVAKAAGAQWDKAAKSWYAGPGAEMTRLQRWLPDNGSSQQDPAMTPREEFAAALRSLGCQVTGDHPVMDGEKHRIPVEGDRKGEQAGFYVGHLDGHPAGYVKNNRTGLEMKWKSKGYALTPQEKAKLHTEAAGKLAARAAEQARLQAASAQRVSRQMRRLQAIEQPTPYLQAKHIRPHAGALTDQDGRETCLPAFDVNGKQWTLQYIGEDGTKRFARDSRKEACFHPVGGMDALTAAPVLVIAEGYATAASLCETLGQATVAAFDSGNLLAVAKALHAKYPDKPILIAGDDDRHLEASRGINPGRMKAEEAARAVGGRALLPIFAPGEQAANPRGFTDFNDLAAKSVLGKEAVERQVGTALRQLLHGPMPAQKVGQQPEQGPEQGREQRPRRVRMA